MKSITKSIIVAIILIMITLISFNYATQKDISSFCNGNTTCIVELVKQNNAYSLCENAINISACYFRSSFNLKNFLLCDFTSNNSNCYFKNAIYFNNVSLCSSTEMSDECIYNIAIKQNNSNLCETTNNSGLCYYSYAKEKNELKVCNLSQNYKKVCYENILD